MTLVRLIPLFYVDKFSETKNINENSKLNLDLLEHFGDKKPKDLEKGRSFHLQEKRLRRNAKDFVEYYSSRFINLENDFSFKGKAMFICNERLACVLMKIFVQEYWYKKIQELRSLFFSSTDFLEKTKLLKQVDFMEETRMEVVISDPLHWGGRAKKMRINLST